MIEFSQIIEYWEKVIEFSQIIEYWEVIEWMTCIFMKEINMRAQCHECKH